MAKRLNIERKLSDNAFKAKIGTVNRLNPSSIYVSGKAYISPSNKQDNYNEEIDLLDGDLKAILRRFTASNALLNKSFISNLEIPRNRLEYGKNTYIFFQFFFAQNFSNKVNLNLDEMKKRLEPELTGVLDQFERKIYEYGFTLHEKRK